VVKQIIIILLFLGIKSQCQIVGGQQVMSFLKIPNSAHASGMGGIVVSNPSNDIMFGFSNPALLRPQFNNHLGLSQNFYIAGSKISNIAYAKYVPRLKTTFGALVTYLDYGSFNANTLTGQANGTFKAVDMALQLNASRAYLTKWHYGAALKIANSKLFYYNSLAILADAGVAYHDTANQFYFGMCAKNIGFQFKQYSTTNGNEPLPYDMQIGLSKKLLKAPIRFNIIGHHLYQWNIRYDNPADIVSTNIFGTDTNSGTKYYFADKLFRHVNFGVDLLLGKNLEINVGYNHLRRAELALADKKGLAGFSFGLGLNFTKLQIHYAHNQYHLAGGYNEIGINFNMKETFGIGKNTTNGIIWQ
jgi:hypothetical protein